MRNQFLIESNSMDAQVDEKQCQNTLCKQQLLTTERTSKRQYIKIPIKPNYIKPSRSEIKFLITNGFSYELRPTADNVERSNVH